MTLQRQAVEVQIAKRAGDAGWNARQGNLPSESTKFEGTQEGQTLERGKVPIVPNVDLMGAAGVRLN